MVEMRQETRIAALFSETVKRKLLRQLGECVLIETGEIPSFDIY